MDDSFGGYVITGDHIQMLSPATYEQGIRERARRFLEEDLWRATYEAEDTRPHRVRMSALHRSRTMELIHAEMTRIISEEAEYRPILLQAIRLGPPVLPPVVQPPIVPEPPAPEPVIPEPVILEDIPVEPELPISPIDAVLEDPADPVPAFPGAPVAAIPLAAIPAADLEGDGDDFLVDPEEDKDPEGDVAVEDDSDTDADADRDPSLPHKQGQRPPVRFRNNKRTWNKKRKQAPLFVPLVRQPSFVPGKKDGNCFNCGTPGHMGRNCRAPRTFGRKNIVCYNCGKQGHISRDCRAPRRGDDGPQK